MVLSRTVLGGCLVEEKEEEEVTQAAMRALAAQGVLMNQNVVLIVNGGGLP